MAKLTSRKINKVAKVNKPIIKMADYTGGQILSGLVISSKLIKTVTVLIERNRMHPLYHKSFRQTKRYLVHDEIGVKEGDLVTIGQIRPISKNKHFKILNIVGQDIVTMGKEHIKQGAAKAIAEIMPQEEQKQPEEIKEGQKPNEPEALEVKIKPEVVKKGGKTRKLIAKNIKPAKKI